MTGHAYGILDVFELKDPAMVKPKKTHRLLRIRNPWGEGESKVKWSDDSEEIEKYKHLLDAYMNSLPPE
jgi:calpain